MTSELDTLREKVREFDIPALLALLHELHIAPDAIEFRGHLGSRPQPALVQDIQFAKTEDTRAVVTLNLGLMSCRTPLPSYFNRLLSDVTTREPLIELLRFIDHSLLAARCRGYSMEAARDTLARVRDDLLRLARPETPDTLHGIFASIFPELDVAVNRIRSIERVARPGVRIGSAELGRAALGNHSSEPVDALEVALQTRQTEAPSGRGWIQEAHKRLYERVFPLLIENRFQLTVALLLVDRVSYLELSGEGYVGYDPMGGDASPEEKAAMAPAPPHRVVLFEGAVVPAVVEAQRRRAMDSDILRSP